MNTVSPPAKVPISASLPAVACNEALSPECPVCTETFGEMNAFGRKVVPVIPHCHPTHRICEECITEQYKRDPVAARRCCQCRGMTMPVVRQDGTGFGKDSPFYAPPELSACRNGDWETLQGLIQQDPSIVHEVFPAKFINHSIDLLSVAAKSGQHKCVEILIKAGAPVNPITVRWTTPLHLAAMSGSVECVEMLLANKANIHAKAKDNNETPLHTAAKYGRLDALEVLIKAKADLEARTRNKATPLHFANNYGYVECVRALIKAGANVNARAIDNYVALHDAARKGHVDCLNELVRAGAKLDAKNNWHGTALYFAAAWGKVDCLNALLAAGADPKARLVLISETPRKIAKKEGQLECVRILKDAEAKRKHK